MAFEIYDRVIICNTGENSDNWILENSAGKFCWTNNWILYR